MPQFIVIKMVTYEQLVTVDAEEDAIKQARDDDDWGPATIEYVAEVAEGDEDKEE